MLDTAKVDAAWPDEDRIAPGGGGQREQPGKRDRFKEFLATGKPVEGPYLQFNEDGSLHVFDGAHRLSVLRDEGAPSIGATVHKGNADRMIELFGTAEEQAKLAARKKAKEEEWAAQMEAAKPKKKIGWLRRFWRGRGE